MPVARLTFSSYQGSNENGGGRQEWQNIQGAGATSAAAGAYSIRDPNSADMNWIQSYNAGIRGSASIPTGATINGMICGFQATQFNGSTTGASYECAIFKNGPVAAQKTGSMAPNGSIGPFGGTTDTWGLPVTPEYFSSGVAFGLHLNFPSISSDITVQAWNGYLDIYYTEAVSGPASISAVAGSNQTAQVNNAYGTPLSAIVRNQGGTALAGVSVTFTLPGSGASGTFPGAQLTAVAVTNAQGIATSPVVTANATVGTFRPVADVTGSAPLVYTLFYLQNTAPPVARVPTTIAIQQGNGQQASVNQPFATQQKVKVFDQLSAVMSNVDIQWNVSGAGASGTYPGGQPAFSFTDSGGVATAPQLTANNVSGVWAATAYPVGYPAVVANFSFTNLADNSPPQATSLVVDSGSNQGAALSTAFTKTFRILVKDQYGSPYPGANVTAQTPGPSYGTFVNAGGATTHSVVSDASGIAGFGAVTAGFAAQASWSITVTAAGTSGTSFTALRNIDATIATSLHATNGMGQQAVPNTAFASPLQARVTNGLGLGVANYAVTFTAPGSSASCRFSGATTQSVNTDTNGFATSVNPVATASEGSYNVTASAAGLTNALFPLQNGKNYEPTVCIPATIFPAGGQNTFTGGAGSPIANWGNEANIGAPGGGVTSTTIQQNAPNTNKSNILKCYPVPGSLSAMNDDSKVISLDVTCWTNGSGFNATAAPSVNVWNATNGVAVLNEQTFTVGYQAWVNAGTKSWTLQTFQSITGKEFKDGTKYVGFQAIPPGNADPSSQLQINGVTLVLCYQNAIEPPQRLILPLLFCEC